MWSHGLFFFALLSMVFAVGGVTWFFEGFMLLRKKRLIEQLETSKIKNLSMGLVEVKGAARWKEETYAPITETPCVYYTYRVEQWQHRHDGPTWMIIAMGDNGETPFFIEDKTGRVSIDPQGGEISAPISDSRRYSTYNELSDKLKNLINKERNSILKRIRRSKGELMFTETCIAVDQQLYILGTVEDSCDYSAGNFVIRKGTELPILYISSREEKEITARMKKSAVKRIIGGPITFSICSFFLYLYYSFSLEYIKKTIDMSPLFKGWIIYSPIAVVVVVFALGYHFYDFTKVLVRSQGD